MQIKINNNKSDIFSPEVYAATTVVGLNTLKSLLILLLLSFSLVFSNNNGAMAGEVVLLENKVNNKDKKGNTHSPYNAFSIGYRFNHIKSEGAVYEDGHGFTIAYDRDFVHTRIFSFGMGFGYDYSKYSTDDLFGPEEDVTDIINGSLPAGRPPYPAGSYFAKNRLSQSLTLHEADINFNFIFNLTRKFKLLAQIGVGIDFYEFKADLYLQAYGNGEFAERKMDSIKELEVSFAVNTNVGFDYDITEHFGIRALFKSSYCNTMEGIDNSLGLVVAAKVLF